MKDMDMVLPVVAAYGHECGGSYINDMDMVGAT